MEQKIKMHHECKKCKSIFLFTSDDVWWDDYGSGYSTKLCRCTECKCINVIKYNEDYRLDINNDSRFYK